ncbi:MAG TPA: proprotein convertase P-domain-containing protein, partial [Saprospiraceae bacterium]|nr:proprotein convertase P-domain-containing protein [Saprospiraceae bacterium]
MKQRFSLIAAYLLIFIGAGFSQNINSCSTWFYDTGGINGDYGNNENYTVQICSDGSGSTHTSLLLYPLELGAGDFLCFYDGEDTNAPLLYCSYSYYNNRPFVIQATSVNVSGCITAEFVSDNSGTGAGWSAEVSCVPSCQPIGVEITQTNPSINPADTGYLDICPGEYVELSARGIYPQSGSNYDQSDQLSSFTWDFGDGTMAYGPSVRHQYKKEGGYYINLTIEDQEGCSSSAILQQRVRVSPKPVFESRVFDETYCARDTIELTSSLSGDPQADIRISPGVETFPTSKVRSDTLFLPDGTGASYSTDLNFLNFAPGQTLQNAEDLKEICLFMEHSYAGDLEIEIICPNGQRALILEEFSASGTVNFGEPVASAPIDANSDDTSFGKPYLYCFKQNNSDYGTLEETSDQFEYTYTTLPDEDGVRHNYTDFYYPEGSYQPAQTFEQLEGCPLNGAWTLRVQDNLSQDNGWVFEWSIDFDEQLYPNLEVFETPIQNQLWTAQPDVLAQNDGELTAIPENGGYARYQLQVQDAFGCQHDTSALLRVYPEVHPDCYSCGEELDWLQDTALCENEELQLGEWASNQKDTIGFDIFPNESFGNASHPAGNPLISRNIIESIYPDQLADPEAQIAEICLDIQTNVVSDVAAWLESPDGRRMLLFEQVGGFEQNFTQTCFTPSAGSPISGGSAPFSGYFQPEGYWNDLENAAVNGEWKLILSDAFGPLDEGVLRSWSIEFLYDYEWTAEWSGEGLSCQDCPDPVYTHENNS